jgi:nucleoid-associated protein EbfC
MTSFPDGGELGELLAQMQRLQDNVAEAEAATSTRSVEGSAADGAVRVRASGEYSFDAVTIDPSILEGGDVSLIEDLVLAAIRDTVTRLTEVRRAAMGDAVHNALAGLLGGEGAPGQGFDPFALDEDDDDEDELDDDEAGDGPHPPAETD